MQTNVFLAQFHLTMLDLLCVSSVKLLNFELKLLIRSILLLFHALKLNSQVFNCFEGLTANLVYFEFIFLAKLLQSKFELLLKVIKLKTHSAYLLLFLVKMVFVFALFPCQFFFGILELVCKSLLFKVTVHQRLYFLL